MRFGDNTEDDSGADNSDGSGEKRTSRKAGELLSFIPKTYSIKSDGRIEAVQVYGIQKRYQPEKHYVFILKITRENEREATFLFRYSSNLLALQESILPNFFLRKAKIFSVFHC